MNQRITKNTIETLFSASALLTVMGFVANEVFMWIGVGAIWLMTALAFYIWRRDQLSQPVQTSTIGSGEAEQRLPPPRTKRSFPVVLITSGLIVAYGLLAMAVPAMLIVLAPLYWIADALAPSGDGSIIGGAIFIYGGAYLLWILACITFILSCVQLIMRRILYKDTSRSGI